MFSSIRMLFAAACLTMTTLSLGGCIIVNANVDGGGGSGGGGSSGGQYSDSSSSGSGQRADNSPRDGYGGSGNQPADDKPSNNGGRSGVASFIDWHDSNSWEDGYQFYAYDTLAYPAQPVTLAAKLIAGEKYISSKDAVIGFYDGATKLGSAKADASGFASITWTPTKAGDYKFTCKVETWPFAITGKPPRVSPTPLTVLARDKNAKMMVVYANDTIIEGGFGKSLEKGKPFPGAPAALAKIAQTHAIVYSVNRQYLMHAAAKKWLANNGFPTGAILMNESMDFADSAKFKNSNAAALKSHFPGLSSAVTKDDSLAKSYAANGVTTYWIFAPDGQKGKDLRKAAEKIRKQNGGKTLQIVSGWIDIQAGVTEGKRFDSDTIADSLDARANVIDPKK